MIIYIHGFGGSGCGVKAEIFREYFKSNNNSFIAPSLSYVPELAVKTLEELIESYSEEVFLIGSSLGGYYAIYLADKYKIKALLLNPSVKPMETLGRLIGNTHNFYDGSLFSWSQKHINMLRQYDTKDRDLDKSLYFLLTKKDDDVLDYMEAVTKLEGSKIIIEDSGGHSFEGVEKHFENIKDFFVK